MANVYKFVTHSHRVTSVAKEYGWFPGARYTNLRDLKRVGRTGFLDIEWKRYDFARHLAAVMHVRPFLTVARDVELLSQLPEVIQQADMLGEYAEKVIIVPKDPEMAMNLNETIPERFMLGYSVPSSYGNTAIRPEAFRRPVHLLGGRPDIQRCLASQMPVVSFDCNRFTLDAGYGDYFDGETFRPHPIGGYEACLRDSLTNINALWEDYRVEDAHEKIFLNLESGVNYG